MLNRAVKSMQNQQVAIKLTVKPRWPIGSFVASSAGLKAANVSIVCANIKVDNGARSGVTCQKVRFPCLHIDTKFLKIFTPDRFLRKLLSQ